MNEKYDFESIEEKWQKTWSETKVFEASVQSEKEKFYCLEMLPYPSGYLHMGHVRNYSIGDALAWYKRLKNFNVIHPIGWDSFGQPAEDAAIKRNAIPREWTEENIEHMRGQLQRLGISYDWSREIAAHRPEYYKFDQWFFLKMYERGLAYKRVAQVNWCPVDKATLSNEQASGGICWRCGNPVIKKDLEQWFLKTTAYADQLLDDMAEIETGWAEKVLKRQRDWIGRSRGAFVDFAVKGSDEKVRVFTTRIDTIYGVNAIVVAAEHPLVINHFNEFSSEVKTKIEQIRRDKMKVVDHEAEQEKDGVATNLFAVNPFSNEEIPIWTANYVLMEYGTGAVMSVSGHDERDFEFAQKYDLNIPEVIKPQSRGDAEQNQSAIRNPQSAIERAFTDYGILINSGEWSGKTSAEANREMAEFARINGFGESATTYRLRDWGISRQKFWGAPIPIVYCEKCGVVPVPYEQLPVRLPENAVFVGEGESPLAKDENFVNTTCPKCEAPARRETDTLDTFVDSSWYFFRYCDPHNQELPFDPQVAAYWTPIDQYIGGDDHAVMHLIYTRFWTKMMRDIGLLEFNEPVKRLMTQGMVVGETFFDDSNGKRIYYPSEQVAAEYDAKGKLLGAKLKKDNTSLKFAIERMSKSKGNGVDPDEMVRIYGADAARLFVLFAAPVENELIWHETGVEGTSRFIQRVYRFVWRWHEALQKAPLMEPAEFSKEAKKLRRKTHETIRKIEDDFSRLQLNTSVAALMELSNAITDFKFEADDADESDFYAVNEAVQALVLMLTPFAPHVAEEMWAALTGKETGILQSGAQFPVFREDLAKKDEIEIPVQVNGKLRSRVFAAPDTPRDNLEQMALMDEKIREHTDGKQIVKVIVVPNRLVNVVVK